MKMSNLFAIPLIASAFVLTSCEDIENICGIDEDDFAVGESYVEATGAFVGIVNSVDVALRDSVLNATGMNFIDGANCTLTSDSLFIDYGNSSSSSRKGRIVAGYTGDYLTQGGLVGIMLDNYSVDETNITGELTIENLGGTGGAYTLELACTNLGIGSDLTFSSLMGLTWTAGYSTTYDLTDDSYTLSGTSSASSTFNNLQFSSTIAPAFVYDRTCSYGITSGEAALTLTGDSISTASMGIDFLGADGCNNIFQLSADCDGNSITVTKPFDGF